MKNPQFKHGDRVCLTNHRDILGRVESVEGDYVLVVWDDFGRVTYHASRLAIVEKESEKT